MSDLVLTVNWLPRRGEDVDTTPRMTYPIKQYDWDVSHISYLRVWDRETLRTFYFPWTTIDSASVHDQF